LISPTRSATVHSLFGSETVKWELGRTNVAVDFLRTNEFTTTELETIEQEMNSHIRSAFSISSMISPRETLDTLPQLRGAPKGIAAEFNELRIVTIAGYDSNPCGGTHLSNTAEIQMFKIVTQEKDRGAVRLRFLSGHRVFKTLSSTLFCEMELSRLLCIPSPEIVSTVTTLVTEKREMSKQIKTCQDELAVFYAQELVTLWSQQLQAERRSYVIQHRPGASLAFLQLAAETISQISEARALGIQAIFLSGSDTSSATASVASSSVANKKKKSKAPSAPQLPPTEFTLVIPSPDSPAGSFIFFSTSAVVDHLKGTISSLLEGKAGGRPGKLQGQATALQNIVAVDELLRQTLGATPLPTCRYS
jgi:alanyl-tRNA synthetase